MFANAKCLNEVNKNVKRFYKPIIDKVMECKLSQKEEGAACLATVVTGAVSRLCRAAADNTGFLPSVAAGHECCAVH